MKIEYPTEEEIRRHCGQILDAAIPARLTFHENMRSLYWDPGPRIIFHQCGSACLITGMVYLLISTACLLSHDHAKRQIFFSLLCCPLLHLTFSLAAFYSEQQTAVIELKQTLHYSFTRLVSLRMFYTSIAAVFLNLVFLGVLHSHPALNSCSVRELWTIGAAGISSMFLFALLSLYLYRRLGSCRHMAILLLIWLLLCTGILLSEDRIALFLFQTIPPAGHLAAAVSSMVIFTYYTARTPDITPQSQNIFTSDKICRQLTVPADRKSGAMADFSDRQYKS